MKYYYGNTPKEALANDPIEIKSTKVLEQYRENYSVVVPACDLEEEDECEEGLTKVLVTFDIDNQNLQEDFESESSAYRYAKENVCNLPRVIRCQQSDMDVELGFGDDYEEIDITYDDGELAEMLEKDL